MNVIPFGAQIYDGEGLVNKLLRYRKREAAIHMSISSQDAHSSVSRVAALHSHSHHFADTYRFE